MDTIEKLLNKAACQCGGEVTVKDSLMLCSECGYAASVNLTGRVIEDAPRGTASLTPYNVDNNPWGMRT